MASWPNLFIWGGFAWSGPGIPDGLGRPCQATGLFINIWNEAHNCTNVCNFFQLHFPTLNGLNSTKCYICLPPTDLFLCNYLASSVIWTLPLGPGSEPRCLFQIISFLSKLWNSRSKRANLHLLGGKMLKTGSQINLCTKKWTRSNFLAIFSEIAPGSNLILISSPVFVTLTMLAEQILLLIPSLPPKVSQCPNSPLAVQPIMARITLRPLPRHPLTWP